MEKNKKKKIKIEFEELLMIKKSMVNIFLDWLRRNKTPLGDGQGLELKLENNFVARERERDGFCRYGWSKSGFIRRRGNDALAIC